MSTSVSRKAPPLLPVLRSRYATFAPPSLKRSASIVPGTLTGVPPYGVPSPPDDALTAIVAVRTTTPYGPSATSVYVVVADGETEADPFAATTLGPGVMVTFVAPVVLHDSVAEPPATIDDGVAE